MLNKATLSYLLFYYVTKHENNVCEMVDYQMHIIIMNHNF